MKLKHLFILSLAAVPGGALAADPQVDIKTNVGTIRLELYPAKAPKTVENFLQYVKDGHYNGTVFHRVIDGFMIQGGGFDNDMQAEADARAGRERGEERPEERHRHGRHGAHQRPALGDRAVLHQRQRQRLPQLSTGAGRLGLRGVRQGGRRHGRGDKIAKTPTGSGGPFRSDVPKQPVVIESMTVVGAKK